MSENLFQRKVENVAYSRLCSSAQPKSMTKTKSSLKQLNETFGPVLTVLVSMASCFLGTEYLLKNIVPDFGLRFAIGLILASLLAIVELIMILKKLA